MGNWSQRCGLEIRGKRREEAGKEEEEEEEEERGGRRALEQLPLATRPRSLISQSDLGPGDTTAHNAIQQQLFQHEPASPFSPFTTAARAGQPLKPFFRFTLRGLFKVCSSRAWRPVLGLTAYCVVLGEWFGRSPMMPAPVLSDSLTFDPLILSQCEHQTLQNWKHE